MTLVSMDETLSMSAQIRDQQATGKLTDARKASDEPRPTLFLVPKRVDPTGPSQELGESDKIQEEDFTEEEFKLYWNQNPFSFAIPESADPIWDSNKKVGYMSDEFAVGHSSLVSELSIKCGKLLGRGVDGECREANIFLNPIGNYSNITAATVTRATVKLLYPGKFNKCEVECLFGLKHPNIVGLYGFLARPEGYSLLMKFVPGMTLYDRLKVPPDLALNEALLIYRGLLRALEHLERNCLVHGDIHMCNVMVVGCKSVLIDFSKVRKLDTPVGDVATGSYHFDIECTTECLEFCLGEKQLPWQEKQLPWQVKKLLKVVYEEKPSASQLLQELKAAFHDLPDDELITTEADDDFN